MRINNRDWTRLSAYLDGQLSPRDVKKLESRLGRQPELQSALEDLTILKRTLAAAPRVPVPRSFKLTPALLGSKPRTAGVAGYRLAAAAFSFLFIAVLVLDVGSGLLKGAVPAAVAPRAEEIMLKSAVEGEEDMIEAPQAQAESAGAAADEALEDQEQTLEAPAQEEAQAEAAAEITAEGTAPEETFQESEQENLSGAPTAPAPAVERGDAGESGEVAQGEQEIGNLPQATLEPEEQEAVPPPVERFEEPPAASALSGIRILEIVLGIAAVGFGIAAWPRRRK